MSFFSAIMEPGGGVMLLPFVRFVIGLLLVLTTVAALLDVARIHMVILAFLSGGLLISLSFFESEFNKMQAGRGGAAPRSTAPSGQTSSSKANNKTD
jgi:hypothetical protein